MERVGGVARRTEGERTDGEYCVKGGFCLINCFSGAGALQIHRVSPAPVLRRETFTTCL